MPELDGHEASLAIRQLQDRDKSCIPIIALTAEALLGSENDCLASGMNSYLSKPIQGALLIEKINECLAQDSQSFNHIQ